MKVPLTIADHLDRAESVYGRRTVLLDEPDQPATPWEPLTATAMGERARAQAAALDDLGVAQGERVDGRCDRGLLDVGDDHAHARVQEAGGHRAPDAACATRDHRDLVVGILHPGVGHHHDRSSWSRPRADSLSRR